MVRLVMRSSSPRPYAALAVFASRFEAHPGRPFELHWLVLAMSLIVLLAVVKPF